MAEQGCVCVCLYEVWDVAQRWLPRGGGAAAAAQERWRPQPTLPARLPRPTYMSQEKEDWINAVGRAIVRHSKRCACALFLLLLCKPAVLRRRRAGPQCCLGAPGVLTLPPAAAWPHAA